MKKFQQNKVATKIALSFMLGSALFLSACSDSTNYSVKDMKDTEKKDRDYYKNNPDEAFEKIKWCMIEVGEKQSKFVMDNINSGNCDSAKLALTWWDSTKESNEKYDKLKNEMRKKYGDIILLHF